MKKHTTIDLDTDLVREAADVLGTTRTTDTIHEALREVVNIRRRLRLLDLRPDLDLADLREMRRGRFDALFDAEQAERDAGPNRG
jgi:Arc/MetJ family transcription regulator